MAAKWRLSQVKNFNLLEELNGSNRATGSMGYTARQFDQDLERENACIDLNDVCNYIMNDAEFGSFADILDLFGNVGFFAPLDVEYVPCASIPSESRPLGQWHQIQLGLLHPMGQSVKLL